MAWSGTSDLRIEVVRPGADAAALFAGVADIPGVATVLSAIAIPAFVGDTLGEALYVLASPDPRWLTGFDRPQILAGRLPATAQEVALDEEAATRFSLTIGGELVGATVTEEVFESVFSGTATEVHLEGPQLRFSVVGIVRYPTDLSGAIGGGASPRQAPIGVTAPAFHDTVVGRVGGQATAFVRLEAGVRRGDVASVIQDLVGTDALVSDEHAFVRTLTRDGIQIVVIDLLVFAAVAFVAGALFVGQAITRHVTAVSTDEMTLRALGLSRLSRSLGIVLAITPAVCVGAMLAGAAAVALSPLTEFGLPGRAEPDAGVYADWAVAASGAVGVALVSVAGAVGGAWRATRRASARDQPRRSAVVHALARLGCPPRIVVGARGAFDRRPAAGSVPVRSALVGTAFALAGVVATVAFAATVARLETSPERWGVTWDVGPVVPPGSPTNEDWVAPTRELLALEPAIDAAGVARDGYVELAGFEVVGVSIEAMRGDLEAIPLEGRAPAAADEVALGSATMRRLGADIGDEVHTGSGAKSGEVRVVGRVMLPDTNLTALDEGALFTPEGLQIHQFAAVSSNLVLRYAPGADRGAIQGQLESLGLQFDILTEPSPPPSVTNLAEVSVVPWALGGLFALLGIAGLAHGVTISARRRRREFAVLEALGFLASDVRASVRWQAVFIMVVGAAAAIPIGVLAGGAAWAVVADNVGVAADLDAPVLRVSLVLVGAFVAGILIAAIPGWLATRRSPAAGLRTE